MSGADVQIHPSQICIGLYVHLDVPWTQHPFTFSSFKIRNLEQVAALQALGLTQIRITPDKSDVEPLSLSGPAPQTLMEPVTGSEDAACVAKRERLARMAARQTRVVESERALMSNARALKSITQNLFARPEQARQEAQALVDGVADSMLVESDLAIQLMADKIGGEEAYHHALNVTILAMMLAKELKAPAAAVRVIGMGALLHDIGKVDIPDRVVRKGSPLNQAELHLLQTHCVKGVELARKLGVGPEVLSIVEQHHEHVDGSGYPKKLQGGQINLLSKIVALVNSYDNLCNPIDASKAATPHEALSTLYGQRRGQFDANVMATFIRSVGIYPPGTLVVLSNGTLGLVVEVNSTRPLKPTVLVYDPAVPKEMAMVVDLEQEAEVTVVRTLRPQQLPAAAHEYLSPRKRMTVYFNTDAQA